VWRKTLIVLVLALMALALFVELQPAQFSISRSTSIAASPEAVFAQVNELRNWQTWSPWAKLDPQAVTTYEGPSWGVGAVSRWSGNRQVGEGSMTILESRPSEYIRFKLEFLKPFKAENISEFSFLPEDGQTRVTWSMSGTNHFIAKAMSLVMNCDKMVGAQFEEGLQNLKSQLES
jgi:hypothetical protein